MLSTDPVPQELNRRLALERGVAATPVVEHLDVLEQVSDDFLAGGVACAVDPLILEAVEEAFGRRIIPAVTLAAHRADHAVLGELGLEHEAGVLAAPGGGGREGGGGVAGGPG